MTIAALNTWRQVYLAEVLLSWLFGGQRRFRFTLIAGASLWLMHDLAHARWRVATADAACLAACLRGASPLAAAAVAYAVANPERPPSPFIWSRLRTHDAS